MYDAFDSLQRREALRRAQGENQARLAWSFSRVTSTGWGEFKIPGRIAFDCTFVERPYLHYAFEIDGEALVATRFPYAQAFVTDWDQDALGNYIGCWVGVTVQTLGTMVTSTVTVDPGYTLTHHLSFAAVATKVLPTYLLKG